MVSALSTFAGPTSALPATPATPGSKPAPFSSSPSPMLQVLRAPAGSGSRRRRSRLLYPRLPRVPLPSITGRMPYGRSLFASRCGSSRQPSSSQVRPETNSAVDSRSRLLATKTVLQAARRAPFETCWRVAC